MRQAPRLEPVVDQEDPVVRRERASLKTKRRCVAAVIGRRCLCQFLAREDATLLTDGDETRMEFAGHRRADDEPARLDPCHLGYCPSSEGIGERRNHAREKTLVDEQTPDVRMPVDPSKPR